MKQDYLKWAHEKTVGAVSTHDSAIASCGKQKCFISSGDQIIEWNLKSASGVSNNTISFIQCVFIFVFSRHLCYSWNPVTRQHHCCLLLSLTKCLHMVKTMVQYL